jgi:hypothetical protein
MAERGSSPKEPANEGYPSHGLAKELKANSNLTTTALASHQGTGAVMFIQRMACARTSKHHERIRSVALNKLAASRRHICFSRQLSRPTRAYPFPERRWDFFSNDFSCSLAPSSLFSFLHEQRKQSTFLLKAFLRGCYGAP